MPESFEQCGLEKTILRHFPYNVNLWPDSRCRSKTMKGFIQNEAALFTRYSLLNEKSLVTRCITYSLSLQNILVIIKKPTRCHFKTCLLSFKTYSLSLQNLLVIIQNLLVIIRNLLVIIQNLLVITSKPTRYHLKTCSLLFKNLVKIHQRFFVIN